MPQEAGTGLVGRGGAFGGGGIGGAPNLIGDTFGSEGTPFIGPSPGSGGVVGRAALADNNKALPQTRLFADFHYFSNVPLLQESDVRRFTPGFERAFYGPLDVLSSFSVRVPMAVTLDSTFIQGGVNDGSTTEFGNVNLITKTALLTSQQMIISGGIAVSLPTADDLTVNSTSGTTLVNVDNKSVHVTPYLAAQFVPNDTFFGHLFYQFDFDTNGSPAYINTNLMGPAEFAGRWQDPTLMIVNGGLGAWLVRNDCKTSGLNGIALSTELHYTKTVQDPDIISAGTFVLGNNKADILNGTIGAHFRLGSGAMITLGYSTPVTDERVFDGEARLTFNRPFGRNFVGGVPR